MSPASSPSSPPTTAKRPKTSATTCTGSGSTTSSSGTAPRPGGHLYKGLVGARTALGDGKGSVADYAKAAKAAGLDFVVFLDDFKALGKDNYFKLVADCQKLSDASLKLIPGYTIKNNIGNHTMCLAEDGYWPEPNMLTGPGKDELNIQPRGPDGKFSGYNDEPTFAFHLNHCNQQRNIGYYNYSGSGKGMKMPFQRNCSLAGVRYYKDGKLVEDMTDDYLTTLQSTMPPTPVVVDEVRSPEELAKEAKSGNALTYVQARSRKSIMADALRWSHAYDGMNVFVSDGPLIHAWPYIYRPMTVGGEEFVTLPAIMESELTVSSDKGLKAISVYDGRKLFRRFLPNGAKRFSERLVLDGTVMKNLVVIAEDVDGGKALSFARRCLKYDVRSLGYCGDHFNDGPMRSFHGSGPLPVCSAPELPYEVAGFTWDGGPPATVPLVDFQNSRPDLATDQGSESGARFNQYPRQRDPGRGLPRRPVPPGGAVGQGHRQRGELLAHFRPPGRAVRADGVHPRLQGILPAHRRAPGLRRRRPGRPDRCPPLRLQRRHHLQAWRRGQGPRAAAQRPSAHGHPDLPPGERRTSRRGGAAGAQGVPPGGGRLVCPFQPQGRLRQPLHRGRRPRPAPSPELQGRRLPVDRRPRRPAGQDGQSGRQIPF